MNSPHADTDSHVIALIRSRQLLQADPQNATAHFEEGIALCQLGQPEEAIAAWTQAAMLEPNNAFAYINIGIAHLQLEQCHEAEQAFRHAAELQPERAEAYYGLGMAYARQGRHEAAQSAWQETLRLAPGHADVRANLAALLEMQAHQQVYSINLGPAQTLQMECRGGPEDQPCDLLSTHQAITSNVLSAAVPESAADSREVPDTPELPVEKLQMVVERPRIKLPELKGPPLESIADTVLAAHEARILANSSPAGEMSSVASGQEQDMPEPTLELDSEDLKREHSRLRRRQGTLLSSISRRSIAVASGAAFMVVLLTYWNLHSRHPQAMPPLSSLSSGTSLARASTNLAAPPSEQPSPALQPASVAEQHDIVADKQVKPVLPAPTVARSSQPRLQSRPMEQHPQRVQRTHATTDRHPSPHRIQPLARPVRAVRVHSAKNRLDEDTFSARAQATHKEAADEWTDQIPK